MEILFSMGQTVITRAALDALHPEDVKHALDRHSRGDWGDLDQHDWKENEIALAEGLRLFSVYRDRSQNKFYVITECDRSSTTVLLPEDY
jgi:hypothetical protein